MGLDMFAYVTPKAPVASVDFKREETDEQLHYWRKHSDLHGWMEELYNKKEGEADSFNCVPVVLNKEDLKRLESDIKSGSLPPTTGFFFGESNGTELNDDLLFINKARQAIAAGNTVYYSSWW